MKHLAILTAALATACASEAEPRASVSQGVSLPAITDEASAERAYGFLEVAAQRACTDGDRHVDIHQRRDIQRCIAEAIEDGLRQIDDPRVTALHAARRG